MQRRSKNDPVPQNMTSAAVRLLREPDRASREAKGPCAGRAAASVEQLRDLAPARIRGRLTALSPHSLEISGLAGHSSVGDRIIIHAGQKPLLAEIVAFRKEVAKAVPFGITEGIRPGVTVDARLLRIAGSPWPIARGAAIGACLHVSDAWLGRIVDPLGCTLDSKEPIAGGHPRPLRAAPPKATCRDRLGERIDLGVRVLNLFATCRRGQRMGLFAAAGVGKSTLLASLARHTACDVAVIALVGERGREVREFIEDDLGLDGLARSVVVVATSDSPAMLRREAPYAAMTIAEHFRDQGRSVLLLVDSITRFCFAAREICLSAGELPTARGYPPSVFADLPLLLERAGPGERGSPSNRSSGSITAFFTVLLEGDETNEPIADTIRGILDGHVILDRKIAESGRYPALDVLRSLSRAVPGCLSEAESRTVGRARAILSLHSEMADMVRLGAYRAGSDATVDEALLLAPKIETMLRQGRNEFCSLESSFAKLEETLSGH
jgi:flagellum-specific ATP synthase